MNNQRSLQIHRCLLAIAITILLANTYPQSPMSSKVTDALEPRAIYVASPAE